MKCVLVVWKEGDIFLVRDAITGITESGKTIEEAIERVKDSLISYISEFKEEIKEKVEFIGVLTENIKEKNEGDNINLEEDF